MANFDPVSYMMGQKAAGGGGSSTLSGLTDVDISNPTDGQTLVYNSTSGKWENGGGPLLVNASWDDNSLVCDKTASEMLTAFQSGRTVFVIVGNRNYMSSVVYADNTYLFVVYNGNEQMSFLASTGSDFPSAEDV